MRNRLGFGGLLLTVLSLSACKGILEHGAGGRVLLERTNGNSQYNITLNLKQGLRITPYDNGIYLTTESGVIDLPFAEVVDSNGDNVPEAVYRLPAD